MLRNVFTLERHTLIILTNLFFDSLAGKSPNVEGEHSLSTPSKAKANFPLECQGCSYLIALSISQKLTNWNCVLKTRTFHFYARGAAKLFRLDTRHVRRMPSRTLTGWGIHFSASRSETLRTRGLIIYFYVSLGKPQYTLSMGPEFISSTKRYARATVSTRNQILAYTTVARSPPRDMYMCTAFKQSRHVESRFGHANKLRKESCLRHNIEKRKAIESWASARRFQRSQWPERDHSFFVLWHCLVYEDIRAIVSRFLFRLSALTCWVPLWKIALLDVNCLRNVAQSHSRFI